MFKNKATRGSFAAGECPVLLGPMKVIKLWANPQDPPTLLLSLGAAPSPVTPPGPAVSVGACFKAIWWSVAEWGTVAPSLRNCIVSELPTAG